MAVTVDLVKKLILQHIGGKPLLGNPKQVFINQGKNLVAIQIPHLGALGSLTGTLGNLVNQAESAVSAVGQLVQNPMAALSSQVSSLAGGVLSQVQGLGLPGAELNKVIMSVGSLQSAASGLLAHTDILSGVQQDVEQLGTTLGAQELMQLPDASDITSMAGALFSDGQVDNIRQSLDPSVPGGVTDLINQLGQTDSSGVTQATDALVKALDDHTSELTTIVQNDLTAQSQFVLKGQVIQAANNLKPDPDNEGQNLLYSRISTSTLQAIIDEGGIDG